MAAHRFVEISDRGRKVSLERGFLVVKGDDREVGRIAIDDVAAVMITATGVSYSNTAMVALAERGAVVAVCGPKYLPVAWLLPVVGHHAQTRIMTAQAAASKPLNKRIWQGFVKAKVRAQANAIEAIGGDASWLSHLADDVRSGDTSNVEGRAAARYFPAMFGPGFRRDRSTTGINELLNYGYTVLRSVSARAIVSAGLHPSVSVQHRRDPLALADDVMEPIRPIVDGCVRSLYLSGHRELTVVVREALVTVMREPMSDGGTPADRVRDISIALASTYLTGRMGQRVGDRRVRSSNDNGRGSQGGDDVSELLTE